MRFARPLRPATLVRRYKRFLADVEMDGAAVTVHCPNPGTMLSVGAPGDRVWVEPSLPGRKLPFAWRLTEVPDGLAGIDTAVPNRVVAEALAARRIPALAAHPEIRAEVPYGDRSRVDFLLEGPEGRLWLEVKNCHLRRAGALAEFPDCVTARGAKHVRELAAQVAAGDRAAVLFVVQRTDCTAMALAPDLDPGFAQAMAEARAAGLEVLAWDCAIDVTGIELRGPLPFVAETP